jgi:lysophospholipase L1-like esterase
MPRGPGSRASAGYLKDLVVILLAAGLAVGLTVAAGRARSADSQAVSALFVGDSFSAGGYDGVQPQQAFPCRTANELGWRCLLDAVGATGYQADGSAFGFSGRSYGQRLAQTRQTYPDPDVIIVSGGRNDDPLLIGAASQAYLSGLAEVYPSARLYVLEPFWMGEVPPAVTAARLAVEASAASAGATWIPTADWLAPADLSWDLVHPTLTGQQAITERLVAVLRSSPEAVGPEAQARVLVTQS